MTAFYFLLFLFLGGAPLKYDYIRPKIVPKIKRKILKRALVLRAKTNCAIKSKTCA